MADKNVSKIVYILTFNAMLVMTGFGIVFPIMPKFLQGVGGSAQDLGYLSAAYSVTAVIFAPIAGKFTDQIGRKKIIFISMFGFGIVNLFYLFANTTIDLIIIRAIEGVFVAGLLPASLAVITDITTENERGKYSGIFYAGFYVGFITGPLLGGVAFEVTTIFIDERAGILSAFILSAILSIIASILTLRILQETKTTSEIQEGTTTPSIIKIFTTKPFSWNLMFFILIWINFFIAFAWLFVEPGVVFYLYDDLGRSPTEFGLIVAVYGGTLIFGQIIFGQLADKVSRHGLILTGLLVFAFGYVILLVNQSYLFFLIFGFLAGLALSLIEPALNALLTGMTSENNRGILLGVSTSFVSLSGILGPIFGGFIYDSFSLSSSTLSALTFLFSISIIGLSFSILLVIARIYINKKISLQISLVEDEKMTSDLSKRIPLEFPSSTKIFQSIKRYWYQLTQIALKDGIVSDDETNLLNSIIANLKIYSEILDKALEDNIITKEESKLLHNARKSMWYEVEQTALHDNQITNDEKELLKKLTSIIEDLAINEKNSNFH